MLCIVTVACELPKDSQFLSITLDLPKATKYTLLWVTKDPQWIKDNKIFLTLMEMNVHMAINHKAQLSPTNFDRL